MTSADTSTWEHSFITIQIYDNTIERDVDTTPVRKDFNGMQVGFFTGGRDNKLLYMPNRTEYLREYCNPNFKKYGQAAYNVDNVLTTNDTGMYVLNLRPDTATYSNFLLMVRFRLVETDEPTPVKPDEPDEPPVVPGDTEVLPYPFGATGAKTTKPDSDTNKLIARMARTLAAPTSEDTLTEGVTDTTEDTTTETPGGTTGEEGSTVTPGDGTDPSTPDGTETGDETELDPDNPGGDDPENPDEPKKKYYKLEYSFYGKYISGGNTMDRLFMAAINTMETEVDDDGYYNMPLFLIYALGRGEYGNNIRIRLENGTEYDIGFDEEPPVRHTYRLRVFEPTQKGLKEREVNFGTFDEDAFDKTIDYGPSLYIQDTINDVQFGSQRIGMQMYMPTYNTICELYNQYVAPNEAEQVTPGVLDLFTQLTLDGTENTNLIFNTEFDDFVNLFALDGVQLYGGTDGWDNMSENQIANTKEELLKEAFRGNIDPVIKSRFSSPCNFCLDAGYSLAVKKEMAALSNLRKYDLMTYLDTQKVSTVSNLINAGGQMRSIYGYNVVKEGHCYQWRDVNYTGKICSMTITHWLGKKLATHMNAVNKGLGLPMARDEAVLASPRDYIPGSFKPIIDPNENDIINTLYKNRINCYIIVQFNAVQRAHAITSCQEKSDRLLEMNEYILQRAIKLCYDILASKLWKLGEQDDRDEFQETANDILKYQLNPYVRSSTVAFEMTKSDEKKGLLRLVLHVIFKTVIKQGEAIIYLDPRVTDDTQESNSSVVTMIS